MIVLSTVANPRRCSYIEEVNQELLAPTVISARAGRIDAKSSASAEAELCSGTLEQSWAARAPNAHGHLDDLSSTPRAAS